MYRYADEDPRAVRGRYFYAPFEGPAFLAGYRETRRAAIAGLRRAAGAGHPAGPAPRHPRARIPEPGAGAVETVELLASLGEPGADPALVAAWLAVLTRKVEVARLLRAGYAADLRPAGPDAAPIEAYARLGGLLASAAGRDPGAPDLGALSALLKVGDVLAFEGGSAAAIAPEPAALAADVLEREIALVATVDRRGVPTPAGAPRPLRWAAPAPAPAPPAATLRPPVLLLAADTARARAYLDLLAAAGIAPGAAVVVDVEGTAPGPASRRPTGLFDNVTPLPAALARAGVLATRLAVDRLDAPAVLDAVEAAAPGVVVVAPPAGILLAPAFFALPGRDYLHVHPGRLPGHRGSTPMYYALLAEGRLTATALFLDAGIDTGRVLAEREFDPPAELPSIDHAFDPWMRAVLLRDVLAAAAAGGPLAARPQPADGGRTWYVIHPVLRHVALLGRGMAAGAARGGSSAR